MSQGDPPAHRARLSWALLVAALALPAMLALRDRLSRAPEALPDYGVVPAFRLVERSGAPVTQAALAGSPWFADFVYTRCESSCPTLSAEMARLLARVGGRARLVSFSVDPAHDTPQTLAAYAERFGAPADGWLFLGGDAGELRRVIREGFHLPVAEGDPRGEPGAIVHSEKIVLVDASLHIRRYYDGGGGRWIDDAVRDLEAIGGSAGAEARS
jgi:protein SCO1